MCVTDLQMSRRCQTASIWSEFQPGGAGSSADGAHQTSWATLIESRGVRAGEAFGRRGNSNVYFSVAKLVCKLAEGIEDRCVAGVNMCQMVPAATA